MIRSLLLLLSVLVFSGTHNGQVSQSRDARLNRAEPSSLLSRYSIQSFDLTITRLPTGFRGHDAEAIYKRLAKRGSALSKREFETTESFRTRITAESAQQLMGGLTRSSIFAFVIGNVESRYDADLQILKTWSALKTVSDDTNYKNQNRSVQWGKHNLSKHYVGRNAFGVLAKVESHKVDVFEVAFENYQDFPVVKYIDSVQEDVLKSIGVTPKSEDDYETFGDVAFAAALKMDPQSARRAKKNLRVLLVCRLRPPYTIEGGHYTKPTIDSPREFLFNNYSLNTELLEVWFFDISTGQVYSKQKRTKLFPKLSDVPSKQMAAPSNPERIATAEVAKGSPATNENDIHTTPLKRWVTHITALNAKGNVDWGPDVEMFIDAELNTDCKLSNAAVVQKSGDPRLVEIANEMVSAISDSRLLQYLTGPQKERDVGDARCPQSPVHFTLKLDQIQASIRFQYKAHSPARALEMARGYNALLMVGQMAKRGGDEEIILKSLRVGAEGEQIVIDFMMARELIGAILKKHLTPN